MHLLRGALLGIGTGVLTSKPCQALRGLLAMGTECCGYAGENAGLAASFCCDPVHSQSRANYGTLISCTAVNELQNELSFKARINSACLRSAIKLAF